MRGTCLGAPCFIWAFASDVTILTGHVLGDRPSQHGTCWQECHCAEGGDCAYTSECVAFTCDDPKLRRRGAASECVKDECTQVRPTYALRRKPTCK